MTANIFEKLYNSMTSNIIKDKFVFSEDYIPEKIMFRDKEKEEIANFILRTREIKQVLKVSGNYGTGKSLITKLVISDLNEHEKLSQDMIGIYINCKKSCTRYKILRDIYRELFNLVFVRQGITEYTMLTRIEKKLEDYTSCVVVLDDVDKIKERDIDDILYILYELPNLSMILISNKAGWEAKLSGATKSRIRKGEHLRFRKYDFYELEKILEYRAKKGLYEGTWNRDLLRYIVDYIEKEGDARSLIQLLYLSALEAERKRKFGISKEDVDTAKVRLEREILLDNIKELPLSKKFILYIIADGEKRGNPVTIDDIVTTYAKLVEEYNKKYNENLRALSKRYIYDLISELHEQGIITSESGYLYGKGKGRKPKIYKSILTLDEICSLWEQK